VYAYFGYEGGNVSHDELADLAADAGASDLPDSGGNAVARLGAETGVAEGETARLWVDTSRMQFFHADDGRALRAGDTAAPVPATA
jgi:multiple sugar transport system ATP-binding protein